MYFRKIKQLAEIPAEPDNKSDSKKGAAAHWLHNALFHLI